MHTTYARDLWAKANLSAVPLVRDVTLTVAGHGVRLLRLWPQAPAAPPPPLPPPPHPPCPVDFAPHSAGYWNNTEFLAKTPGTVVACAAACRKTEECVAFEVYLGSGYPGQCYNFLSAMSLPFTASACVTCVTAIQGSVTTSLAP